jgi:hypothetical protein
MDFEGEIMKMFPWQKASAPDLKLGIVGARLFLSPFFLLMLQRRKGGMVDCR